MVITPIVGITLRSSSIPETTKNIRYIGGVTESANLKILSPSLLLLTRAAPIAIHKSSEERFSIIARDAPKKIKPQVIINLLEFFLKNFIGKLNKKPNIT